MTTPKKPTPDDTERLERSDHQRNGHIDVNQGHSDTEVKINSIELGQKLRGPLEEAPPKKVTPNDEL